MVSKLLDIDVRDQISSKLYELGFDEYGISGPDISTSAKINLRKFIQNDYHGTMDWMKKNIERREDPLKLWPSVRSILVVAMNCGPPEKNLDESINNDQGVIASYALGEDYHKVMMKKLKEFALWLTSTFNVEAKVFVDTAPILEKTLAEKSGLGWQGKHTNLVSRSFGSWLMLGEVFTTLNLSPDKFGTNLCGRCTRCLDVCPTNAFPSPYVLDARKCISYLTIEYKGHISTKFREAIGNKVFGCDDCLSVCPWNKYAHLAGETLLLSKSELTEPKLRYLALLDDKAFRKLFRQSSIFRTGRNRFVRNVLIAIGNSHIKELADVSISLLDDQSPLVRAMAIWSLSRLDSEMFNIEKRIRKDIEKDLDVRSEWGI